MIAALFFYIFAAILLASAAMVVTARNPVHSRAVPDPRLLQRRRPVPDRRRRVPGDDPGHRLCRRGRGAVPVRRHDAGHRLRGAARAASSATLPVGAAVGAVLLVELGIVLGGWKFAPAASDAALRPGARRRRNTARSGGCSTPTTSCSFQAAGLMLLVAMIGAIVLTLRDRTSSRHQIIARQIARRSGRHAGVRRRPHRRRRRRKRASCARPKPEPEPAAPAHAAHGGH